MGDSERPQVDSFGRTITGDEENVPARPGLPEFVEVHPDAELPSRRSPFDGSTEMLLTFLDEDEAEAKQRKAVAAEIARPIVRICSPGNRPDWHQMVEKAGELFVEFSKHSEMLFNVFFEAITKLSPQIEPLAALVGYYSVKYPSSFATALVEKKIPSELAAAVKNDHFRTVKLLLRFLTAFTAFGVVKVESYVSLLQRLTALLDASGMSNFRGEALCRALIIAAKMCPEKVPVDVKDAVINRVKKFIEERGESFVKSCAPFGTGETTIVSMLVEAEDWKDLWQDYLPLFNSADEFDEMVIPEVELAFGETDKASFPLVLLSNAEPTLWSGVHAMVADIADDILVYFGQEKGCELAAAQMLALPALLGFTAFTETSNEKANFVVQIFVTVIMSDLLRLPDSYYSPVFHAALFVELVRISKTSVVLDQMAGIFVFLMREMTSLDVGCATRMVRFFSHQVSNWSFSFCWSNWREYTELPSDDPRRIFLNDVISQCMFLGNPDTIKGDLLKELDVSEEVFPPPPAMNYAYHEGSEFATQAASLLETISNETADGVYNVVNERVSALGEWEALRLFLNVVFFYGRAEADRTTDKICDLSELFKSLFKSNDSGAPWQQDSLMTTAAEFYSEMPPVFHAVVGFLMTNGYCGYQAFINYFFKTKKDIVALIPNKWKLFHGCMDIVMKTNIANGQITAAQVVMKDVFEAAAKFTNDVTMSEIDERYFVGNMVDFGRRYYEVFSSVGTSMNGLIVSGTAKKSLVTIVETVNLFC